MAVWLYSSKLVSTKHFISEFADEYKLQYSAFLQIIVNAGKASFLNFDINSTSLDVFLIGYLKDSVRFNKLVGYCETYFNIVPWPVKCGTGF